MKSSSELSFATSLKFINYIYLWKCSSATGDIFCAEKFITVYTRSLSYRFYYSQAIFSPKVIPFISNRCHLLFSGFFLVTLNPHQTRKQDFHLLSQTWKGSINALVSTMSGKLGGSRMVPNIYIFFNIKIATYISK